MAWHSKVIWTEGLFLRPQHLQQHDRYLEHLLDSRCASLHAYGWGITELTIDKSQLSLGNFSVASCKGIFPDGTPFSIPDDATPPSPLAISEELHNEKVYLGLPLKRRGLIESNGNGEKESLARFNPIELDVNDSSTNNERTATLQVGDLRLRLLLEHEIRSDFSCIGLARIVEARPDKGVLLDEAYLPPCLECSASARLKGVITELQGLLEHRCDALGRRVTDAGRGGVAEVADFLMLLLVNRSLPLVRHFASMTGIHPEAFYRTALQIAGELATFTSTTKTLGVLPPYQHDDLESTFAPLIKELKHSLSMVLEQTAIAIPLEERKYGVRVATLGDKNALREAQFILAVKAQVNQEVLQSTFPSQAKIGSIDQIRQMVNSGLPGIGLRLLPVAPRQIPYHAGFTYFELDKTSRYWTGLEQSGAFAVHISGEFPGLEIEFWAIKG